MPPLGGRSKIAKRGVCGSIKSYLPQNCHKIAPFKPRHRQARAVPPRGGMSRRSASGRLCQPEPLDHSLKGRAPYIDLPGRGRHISLVALKGGQDVLFGKLSRHAFLAPAKSISEYRSLSSSSLVDIPFLIFAGSRSDPMNTATGYRDQILHQVLQLADVPWPFVLLECGEHLPVQGQTHLLESLLEFLRRKR